LSSANLRLVNNCCGGSGFIHASVRCFLLAEISLSLLSRVSGVSL
jgi:hypothetical protein